MMKLPRRFIPGSIRARLSVLFSIVFGAALALTSLVCFKVFTHTHLEDFDAFLFNHAVDIESETGSGRMSLPASLSDPPSELRKHRLFSVKRTYFQIFDGTGRVLTRSDTLEGKNNLPHTQEDYRSAVTVGEAYRTVGHIDFGERQNAQKPYRLIFYRMSGGNKEPLVLQVAAPLTLLQKENTDFLWLLLVLIPFSVIVSGCLGYATSRRAFSPVVKMAQKTAQIEVRNLQERIEVRESDAELKELGRTLNQLLERVESSVLAQERFIADASHQLKTPLAILRGELELLQARSGHPAPVIEALKNASQEVSQLISLVENLLLLARMDAGLDTLSFQSVRLDELLFEAVNRLQFVAGKMGVKLSSELRPYAEQPDANIDFEFQGDGDLIRCLFENLIENAIKYSPQKGEVGVRLAESQGFYKLEISDQGVGISETEGKAMFERFWREPKKALGVQGAGLGLAIAKKITEIHRGKISAQGRSGGGTTFVVQLSKH
jgi:signal transduction histidine kinase